MSTQLVTTTRRRKCVRTTLTVPWLVRGASASAGCGKTRVHNPTRALFTRDSSKDVEDAKHIRPIRRDGRRRGLDSLLDKQAAPCTSKLLVSTPRRARFEPHRESSEDDRALPRRCGDAIGPASDAVGEPAGAAAPRHLEPKHPLWPRLEYARPGCRGCQPAREPRGRRARAAGAAQRSTRQTVERGADGAAAARARAGWPPASERLDAPTQPRRELHPARRLFAAAGRGDGGLPS